MTNTWTDDVPTSPIDAPLIRSEEKAVQDDMARLKRAVTFANSQVEQVRSTLGSVLEPEAITLIATNVHATCLQALAYPNGR